MLFLVDGLQISTLLVCLVGLTLGVEYYYPQLKFSFLFCAAPFALVALLFFLEHFFPLGRPAWLYLPCLLASLYLIYRRGFSVLTESSLWFFFIGFTIAFLWRFNYPDLTAYIERIADHSFIIDYSRGERLPPEDALYKGAHIDMYYAFQYYAAAWISRALGASTGTAYNLGFCLLVGLASAGVGGGIRALTQSNLASVLALSGVLLGGNGASIVIPFMSKTYSYWDSMLFIGIYALPGRPDFTPFGRWLVDFIHPCITNAGMEYYAHTIVLGDYHPSLSSLLFLGVLILAIGLAEREPAVTPMDTGCVALACATPFYLLVANAWTAPLQLIAVVSWLAYRFFRGKRNSLRTLFFCFLIPICLIYPYLCYFSYSSQNYNLSLQWTTLPIPILNWALVMAPALGMLLICFIVSFSQRLAIYVTGCGIFFFAFSFFFHIDDYAGGIFNTSLKWWPWAFSLIMLLGLAVAWKNWITRTFAVILTLLPVAGYLIMIGPEWWYSNKNHMGQLDGSAWIRDDQQQRYILNYLNVLPRGVLLQSCPNTDDAGVATYAQFTPHYALAGWIDHERIWRGYWRPDLQQLVLEKLQFYQNKLSDPRQWLLDNDVDYVLWLEPDNLRDDNAGLTYWAAINERLKGNYTWHTFAYPDAPPPVHPLGVWTRVPTK